MHSYVLLQDECDALPQQCGDEGPGRKGGMENGLEEPVTLLDGPCLFVDDDLAEPDGE